MEHEYVIAQLGIDWPVTADESEKPPYINSDGSFDPDAAEEYSQ